MVQGFSRRPFSFPSSRERACGAGGGKRGRQEGGVAKRQRDDVVGVQEGGKRRKKTRDVIELTGERLYH